MKLWVNTSFKGHWPVGASAVVCADTDYDACFILEAELNKRGLGQEVKVADMVCISGMKKGDAMILQDGNY